MNGYNILHTHTFNVWQIPLLFRKFQWILLRRHQFCCFYFYFHLSKIWLSYSCYTQMKEQRSQRINIKIKSLKSKPYKHRTSQTTNRWKIKKKNKNLQLIFKVIGVRNQNQNLFSTSNGDSCYECDVVRRLATLVIRSPCLYSQQ